MNTETRNLKPDQGSRVLVVSALFAPCKEVGGKRFSFLSRYLAGWCGDYHVLARRERERIEDPTAFRAQVHRVKAFPDYFPGRKTGLVHILSQAWERWFCLIDPYIGWVLPATVKGIRLCRRHRLNLVVVTVPHFSAIIAGSLIARVARTALIVDYRDPMTSLPRRWPRPFGDRLSRAMERAAIRHADAIVFCSEIMKDEFLRIFGDIAPARLEVIHNGFVGFDSETQPPLDAGRINMVYAGEFYGSRRLSVIAPTLAEMQRAGEISPENFRLHLYAVLRQDDYELIDQLGIRSLVEVHKLEPYHAIKKIIRSADILFLPSGEDVAYAIPYKFFDYLSAQRPILAVAPVESSVHGLMQAIDCGEFACVGDSDRIRDALGTLVRGGRTYTFMGADRFRWENAADAYMTLIRQTTQQGIADPPAGP